MKTTQLMTLIFVSMLLVACSSREATTEPNAVKGDEKIVEEKALVPAPTMTPSSTPTFNIDELVEDALAGKSEPIEVALKNGMPPNTIDQAGRTLILYAAFNGHTDLIKKLVNAGGDMNAVDALGSTALMFASSGPFKETVTYLLKNGAEVNAVDSNEHFSALMWAAAEGQVENVKLLLEYKADLTLQDVDGDTAESFAAKNGHTEVVAILKEAAQKK